MKSALAQLTSVEFQRLTEEVFGEYGKPFDVKTVQVFDKRKKVSIELEDGTEVSVTIEREVQA